MLTESLRKGSTTVQDSDYTVSKMNHAASDTKFTLIPTSFDTVLIIRNIIYYIFNDFHYKRVSVVFPVLAPIQLESM